MRKWLLLALLIIVLDQLTKIVVVAHFQLGEVRTITSFFDLVLVYNPGAAFSFLADAGGWQRWFFTGLAFVICSWLFFLLRQHAQERLMPLAIALVMGGALGNVIDRFAYGAVVDFLSFHIDKYYWPAFNVADSGITVGAMLIIWCQFVPHSSRSSSS
ncbi:MAG: signal peptidase II [Sterolibacterium sp.]|nr:signal peptidase II [Sterolibacterium sp.]